MNTKQHEQHKQRVELLLKEMPGYVVDYARASWNLSPTTLLNYIHDYKLFFEWLLSEGMIKAEKIKDIPLSTLENLKKKEVEYFLDYLTEHKVNVTKNITKTPEKASVNRRISALKSLFNFLTTEPFHDNEEPYFYRNVMAGIKVHKNKSTLNARAAAISAKILHNNDDVQFLRFVVEEYIHTLPEKSRKRAYFTRDKERDLAILSLFLGSGLRVNEVANIRLKDIDWRARTIAVTRKGNKQDIIPVSQEAIDDVASYLKVRNERYGGTDNEYEYLFLVIYNKESIALSVRSIQSLVKKYTSAFNKAMSPHKLRHTFATKHYETNKDPVALMNQLGHTSSDTTILYTNPQLQKAREAIDRMSERTE